MKVPTPPRASSLGGPTDEGVAVGIANGGDEDVAKSRAVFTGLAGPAAAHPGSPPSQYGLGLARSALMTSADASRGGFELGKLPRTSEPSGAKLSPLVDTLPDWHYDLRSECLQPYHLMLPVVLDHADESVPFPLSRCYKRLGRLQMTLKGAKLCWQEVSYG